MPTLLEKPPTHEQPEVTTTSRLGKLLAVNLLIGCILTIVASLNYVTKSDEDRLEALQAKIENREPLEKYEKETYCDPAIPVHLKKPIKSLIFKKSSVNFLYKYEKN